MNEKSKFPFIGLIIVFVLFITALFMMCFMFWPSWKERSFENASMSPWIFLIPIFIIAMIVMCIFCRRRNWVNMCDWSNWKRSQDRDKESGGGQNYIEILKTRLARGEINEEEFDRLVKKISQETSGK